MAADPIYLSYDQAALDRQYNNQLRVPGFADYVTGWQRESARVRAALPGVLDVAFGPTADEVLDIYLPAKSARPAPVQVFYHGGYWRSFKASDFAFVAERLVEAGAIAVIVNYALVPAVRIGELVRQCRAALAWVHANIGRYGGDADRIHLSGHSAGGHLVAAMAAMASQPGEPDTLGLLQGGVAISGLYDLEPIRLCYLNEKLGLDVAEEQRNSPIRHLPASAAPLVVTVGLGELPELVRQSQEYAAAWTGRGLSGHYLPVAGHEHFSILEELARPGGAILGALQEMAE